MEDKDTLEDLQIFIWFVCLQNEFCPIREVLKIIKEHFTSFSQFSNFVPILGRSDIRNFPYDKLYRI